MGGMGMGGMGMGMGMGMGRMGMSGMGGMGFGGMGGTGMGGMGMGGMGMGGMGSMQMGGMGNSTMSGDLTEAIAQFVSLWQLDAGAEQMLRNASPQLAQMALSNFNPGSGVANNNSGKFVAYLKKLPQYMGITTK